uniref:Dicer-1 n=3 Tax=Parascaris univalens TaxID=6257 RepID=A0A915BN58_PARUN
IMVIRTSTNDVDKNFFTPRDYQIELLDKACRGNVIVPLGTGSGKTFIAVLLIKEHTCKLIEPLEKGGKRAFFLVDKVSLVDQQAAHIEHHTTLKVGRMHGHLNSDIWSDRSKFSAFIAEHHVVVSTAQVFLDVLDHAFFNMNNAALLIFDECHHVLGSKHAYRVIMHRYSQLSKSERPKILGLTASLINNKTPPSNLERVLEKLELVMQSSIETASDLVSVAKYGAKPKEFVIECEDFVCDECRASKKVISLLEDLRTMCVECREFHPEFDVDPRKPLMEAINRTLSVFKQMGPWCAWKVCQLFQRQLKKHISQPFLTEKQILLLQIGETTMRLSKKILDEKVFGVKCYAELKPLLPNRIVRLMEILDYYSPSNISKIDPNFSFCGIIFVKQRYVAYVMNTLVKAIAKWDKDRFGYVVSDFLIGYSSANIGSEETMALHKRQEEVLRKFRQKQLNLLVATSVLEEGVDVKQCNVVIRFDRPTDYRAYIQSKGRARKEGASYYILIEHSDRANCSSDLKDFFQIEQMLLKRYRTAHNPPDGMPLCSEQEVDAKVAPYVVESTGARVTMSSAISLVNRYCAKLPSDIFTRLVPQNRIIPVSVNGSILYKAELLLPINSPLKNGITLTTPMETKKLAQMAVALETCRRLHEHKELNDHLLPVGKDTITLTALDDDPDEFIPNMNYKVGSARRKQLYDKRMAKELNGALPDVDTTCFIYVMEMDLIKAVSGAANPKNRKIVNPIDTEFCFGFLSKKKIPNVPSFPVFLRQGRMQANIFLAKSRLQVDAVMLELIKAFHHYIFDSVLRLVKGGLAFVPENAPVSILIVPLRRERNEVTNQVDFKLDYTYVRNVVSSIGEMPRVPDEEERKLFKFDVTKFQDAVVMPWYRDKEHPSFYYVAEIIDANPSSKFPDEKFANFNDYFIQKYNIEIYDQRQPLLDVDYTSSRLNLLMPRHTSRSRTRVMEERKPGETSSQGQILVPELVDVHPIAASLWNVIAALPTLLYRINCLLLADELRETIVSEALGLDSKVPEDYVWPPLDYTTPMDDSDFKPVQKIQHLRQEYDERMARERELEPKESDEFAECSFEIGVWDPELGGGLEPLCSDRSKHEVTTADDFEDTMGLMTNGSSLRHHGVISDDEEEDAVVLFDFMNTLGKEKADLFAPRDNIESAGWDDLEVHEEIVPSDVNMPLSVNSGSAMIDSRALMADLSKMSWGIGQLTGQSPLIIPPPNNIAGGTVNSLVNFQTEQNRGSKSSETRSVQRRKQPLQLYLDSMERLEDTDRGMPANGRNEESVDLIQFLDDEEELNKIRFPPLSYLADKNCILDVDLGESSHESHVLVPMQMDLPGVIASTSEDSMKSTSSQKEENKVKRLGSDAEILVQALQEDELRRATISSTSTVSRQELMAPKLDWMTFSFEEDSLDSHPYGVSPCTLLQALTMSNASDGINLERLETVGDSFLKYAVTDYLFHMNPEQHEGKLSFARSKEVSNCNLYRLGKKRNLPSLMVGAKFDPNDSWLPPCYAPTSDFKAPNSSDAEERDKIMEKVLEGSAAVEQTVKVRTGWDEADSSSEVRQISDGVETINIPRGVASTWDVAEEISPLPYNMLTQQYLGDKSIADAVEALIGAHLLELGPTATLKFMKWVGLKVLTEPVTLDPPLLRFIDTPQEPQLAMCKLNEFWMQFQFSKLEDSICYRFKDRAYLLQAFTHASYYKNRITGCYQRLEFLGDAVLDYVITRFLFQHPRQYSPGVLTDLRSALVNNTIFASLAVKYNFHKHFVAMCPGLHHMIEKFVRLCAEKNFSGANFNAEMYMVTTEEEIDEGEEEDIEVPKAMGDIFESVAGAVYLDSGRSLDVVWRVFYNLMKETIEECCNNPPKSPIRELLELEPERARFSKLERILETGKVRVTVDIQGKCRFTGMGRSYRIAKCTAAKRALRYLRKLKEEKERAATAKA